MVGLIRALGGEGLRCKVDIMLCPKKGFYLLESKIKRLAVISVVRESENIRR